MDYNHVLHESVVIVSVETKRVPHIPRERRIAVDELGYEDEGILHLTIRYGFRTTRTCRRRCAKRSRRA